MAIFEVMAKELNIRLHRVTNRNHKAIGVERSHQFLNHNATIISSARQTHKYFVEVALISVYAWNAMSIDGTDKIRSIPAIGRSLKFPMDVALSELPTPVGDAAQATVSCIRQIERDARFAKELIMWLVEERQQRHRERINDTKKLVQYKVNDMVMTRVQVNNSAAQGVVGKLSIEARGSFRVVEDHDNGSYSVQPFDKPNSVVRKFQLHDIYALSPQILPFDDVYLPEFRYLNTDFAPVKHPFKDYFNIKSYKIMWLDNKSMIPKPDLKQICEKDIAPIMPPAKLLGVKLVQCSSQL